jgi:hypothetical protein
MVITSLLSIGYRGSFLAYRGIRVKARAFSNAYEIFLYNLTDIDFTKRFRTGLKGLYFRPTAAHRPELKAMNTIQRSRGIDRPISGIRLYMPLVKTMSQIRA